MDLYSPKAIKETARTLRVSNRLFEVTAAFRTWKIHGRRISFLSRIRAFDDKLLCFRTPNPGSMVRWTRFRFVALL